MPETPTRQIYLSAHPFTPCDAVRSLAVRLSLQTPGVVTLCYTLRGDMSRIRVGAEGAQGSADGLWKHTCFEAFVRPAESAGYYEFNFAPTRQWAVYQFDSYRQGMTTLDLANPPVICTSRTADYLELDVTVPLPFNSDSGAARRTKLAVTAVIEEDSGRLCYWSGRHPQGKPDFHHAANFAFDL